jgi:hypothetical protein
MNLNISYDANTLRNAPSTFFSDVNYVANLFDSTFKTNAIVNIEVGYGTFPYDNSTVSGLGESIENNVVAANYGQVEQQLLSTGAPGASTLPAAAPIAGTLIMGSAQEKALGLMGASGALDGWVGIASNATLNHQNGGSWSFSPTALPGANQYYIVGAIEHEISEVMGRVSYLSNGGEYGVMDLYRYAAPGVRQVGTGDAAYFSTNGGITNLDSWNDTRIASGDLGDWAPHAGPTGVFASAGADAFNDFSNPGLINGLSATDIALMQALGWGTSAGSQPAALAVTDTTTNQAVSATGSAYAGPVPGLQQQYVYSGTDNINVSVSTNNWFLHGGSGDDALAAFGGTNVLDGGSGSNFLTGGSSIDTFFVDDRGPGSDIWSTVSGFHAGDAATVFGISPSGANTQWLDGQGAAGYAGLTLHATIANHPTASLTLSGYSTADLSNGRLSVSFGNEPDGTPYMYVLANGAALPGAANAASSGDGSSDLLLASGGVSQSPASNNMTFADISSDVPDGRAARSGDPNGGGSLDELFRNASSAAVAQWLHAADLHRGWPVGDAAAWHTAGV